ncbi:hypothetical protein [Marinobacter alexandrii]|uniref:hypothetical protein n=1 Tax=Marinobacter alexandrii TaxID=2570351 RepID=UPI00329878FA
MELLLWLVLWLLLILRLLLRNGVWGGEEWCCRLGGIRREVALVNFTRWVRDIYQRHSTAVHNKIAYPAAPVTSWAGVSGVDSRFGALRLT